MSFALLLAGEAYARAILDEPAGKYDVEIKRNVRKPVEARPPQRADVPGKSGPAQP